MTEFEATIGRLAKAEEAYKTRHEELMRQMYPYAREISKGKRAAVELASTPEEAWKALQLFRGIAYGHEKWEAFKKWIGLTSLTYRGERKASHSYLENAHRHFFR